MTDAKKAIFAQLHSIVAGETASEPDAILAASYIKHDLGLDDAALTSIIAEIEARYNVTLERDEWQDDVTLDFLVDEVKAQLDAL